MPSKCPKPEKGESKQKYLSRCVRHCVDGGMNDTDAFSACTLEAHRHDLSLDTDVQHFSGTITLLAPEAPQAEKTPQTEKAPPAPNNPCRFAILGHTGQVVERWFGRMIFDLSGMRVEKTSMPALRDHDAGRIVGYTQSHTLNATGLHLYGVFSNVTADAQEVLGLAEEGFPWQASIGVKPDALLELKAGASTEVNGITVEGPIYIATMSTVHEISFCPLGADNNTAAIVMAGKEHTMPNSLPADQADKNTPTAPHASDVTVNQLAAGPQGGAPAHIRTLVGEAGTNIHPTPQQLSHANVDAALTQERERVNGILALCATHKLDGLAQQWITGGHNLDQARGLALEALAAQSGGTPVGRAGMGLQTGVDESDKFRALAAEGISMALGCKVEKPLDGSRQFMGLGILDMARLALDRAGAHTMGLSPAQVADAIFSRQYRLAASVADFSAVFMDVANKRLLQSYAEAGRTYDPWTNRVNARDFREMYGISLSEAASLERVGENEEYTTGSLKDGSEAYRVYKYGKIIRISWEMLVNDDLNAFARIPAMIGAATARTFSDVVYGVLTDNKSMADGKPIFDAAHKNIVNPASGITDAGMNAARLTMRMQTGLNGTKLNLSPSFLLVPPSLENTAYVLLKSAALPKEGLSAGVYNPWGDSRITPIVEQRLEPAAPNAAKPWYLTASPSSVSTIDVAYLDGKDTPDIIEHTDFNVDAFSYKARACIGAAAVDHRGLVKNTGVTS